MPLCDISYIEVLRVERRIQRSCQNLNNLLKAEFFKLHKSFGCKVLLVVCVCNWDAVEYGDHPFPYAKDCFQYFV